VVFVVFIFWNDVPMVSTMSAQHVTTTTLLMKQASHSNSNSNSNPVVHTEEIHGVDVLWAIPHTKRPCGIFLVAHGCSHSHTDFFSTCDGCLGLPEERAIVQTALTLNLAVVAISSQNRHTKCWKSSEDGPRAAKVLKEFSNRFSPSLSSSSSSSSSAKEPIPIYAFGASSGGGFVSQLGPYLEAEQLVLNGFLSQIMAKVPPAPIECEVYITMDRDKRTDARANEIVSQATSSTKAKHIQLPPLQLSESFFADRIEEVSPMQSSLVFDSLKQAGYIDHNDGRLTLDPRHSDWRSLVQPHIPESQDSLTADASPISEVMNAAYGMHEMAREGVEEALTFCLEARTFLACAA
jgi:hypothetical protein